MRKALGRYVYGHASRFGACGDHRALDNHAHGFLLGAWSGIAFDAPSAQRDAVIALLPIDPVRRGWGIDGEQPEERILGLAIRLVWTPIAAARDLRHQKPRPCALLEFRHGSLTPAAAAVAAETAIGQKTKRSQQAIVPLCVRRLARIARHGPQSRASFEFDARAGLWQDRCPGDAIHRRAASHHSTERAGAWPVAPQQAAASRVWYPLIGENALSDEDRFNYAQRNESRCTPANLAQEDRARCGHERCGRGPERRGRRRKESVALKWKQGAQCDRRIRCARCRLEPWLAPTHPLH